MVVKIELDVLRVSMRGRVVESVGGGERRR